MVLLLLLLGGWMTDLEWRMRRRRLQTNDDYAMVGIEELKEQTHDKR